MKYNIIDFKTIHHSSRRRFVFVCFYLLEGARGGADVRSCSLSYCTNNMFGRDAPDYRLRDLNLSRNSRLGARNDPAGVFFCFILFMN